MTKRLVLLGLVSALALILGFVSFTPWQAVTLVRVCGYWLVLLTAALFAVHLVRSLRDYSQARRRWREWWRPALFALAATAFLHIHERHEFKIVADEVVLQLTAQRMHFDRQAAVVVRGYDYAGDFMPFVTFVDKRPLFFPFLLSVVHDLTGYRVSNVFVLNAALSLALVLLLMSVARRVGGWGGAYVAILLLIGVPLVEQNACGSGFELLNLVMILLTWWLGMRAVEYPLDNDRLGAFVLSGVLLTQVRYESVLFVLPVAATVAYLWWRARAIRLPGVLIAVPLLLVMCPLQYNVFKVSQASWQLGDVAGADYPFGLRYFYDNVGHAMNFFLCFDGTQPNSWLVGIAGAFGVGFFMLLLYRRHREIIRDEPGEAVFCIFLLGLLVHTAFMLCYFWGRWDDVIIRRLSLPVHLLLILAVIYVWPRLVPHSRRWLYACTGALAYLIFFATPSMAMHRYTQQNMAARATNWLGRFIRTLDDRPVIAIDENAGLQWFLYGKSSINMVALAQRADEFLYHFQRRSFADYFVIQRVGVDAKTGERFISGDDDLGLAVQLQLIDEKAFSPIYLVRLSRITTIDEKKFKEWAETRKKVVKEGRSRAMQAVPDTVEADQLVEWLRKLP
ncbi:MAG: glycosyltransferase family 39 protein [Opitutaceae bacterium]|nr:glycosyltransferase family 39 protein [Opitutaceae bacterium]